MRALSSSRFASICALLALVVALAGTAYAAGLPRNSVGTPQLKSNAVVTAKIKKDAVTSSRIKNRTITARDLKAGVLPTRPIIGVLPRGATQRGYLGLFATADRSFAIASDSVTFPFPLPADLPKSNVHRVDGTVDVPQCPGTLSEPEAEPGHLCVYVGVRDNVAADNVNGPLVDDTASRFGFTYFIRSTSSGEYSLKATWAVTGP